ncbi:hypothetical protein FA15DRAFT_671727 [Coprinopsis marcescibilis]|uniref:Uncharacterized protein n=1 Tax=Coprinopsis marcescibilis TaxID=230819 RepID=A0A5C3KQ06_COPMA|nr:hypothetical protein FA15DRAFT_671727 [Coprinopsis marcescibilis]
MSSSLQSSSMAYDSDDPDTGLNDTGRLPVIDAPCSSNKKLCKTCRKPEVYEFEVYVNCTACRKKNNDKRRIKKLEYAAMVKRLSNVPQDATDSTKKENYPPLDGRKTVLQTTKGHRAAKKLKELGELKELEELEELAPPQSHKPFGDLEGEEQRLPAQMMKEKLKQVTKDSPPSEASHNDHSIRGTEYQTASGLYKALKSAANKASSMNPLQFRGYHSIIAMDNIGHKAQCRIVEKDIRTFSNIQFDRRNPTSRKTEGNKHVVTYKCTCKGEETLQTLQTLKQPKAPAGLEGAELARWLRANKKQGHLVESTAQIPCEGVIVVAAEDDNSHPCHGIPGQRISVTIKHS